MIMKLGTQKMRFKQNLFAATIMAVGFSTGMAPAIANEIGQVKVLVDYGYSTAPGESRGPIFVRDDVVAESLLETVRDGRMDIEFDDKTKLIVGPNSTVKLDRFVYDPNKSSGEVAVNMSRGVLRFVTGRLSSQSYKIKTPTATMGVRGTDFVVQVDETGATTVSVLDGEVSMTSDGGDDASVGAGSTGSTSGSSVSVSSTTGLPAVATASFGVDEPANDNTGESDEGSSSSGT
jgi:hypothetical protein